MQLSTLGLSRAATALLGSSNIPTVALSTSLGDWLLLSAFFFADIAPTCGVPQLLFWSMQITQQRFRFPDLQ